MSAVAAGIGPLLDLVTLGAAVVAVLAGALIALEVRSRLVRSEGDVFVIRAPSSRSLPESFFMALHGLRRSPRHRLLRGQPWIGLELAGRAGTIELSMWIPRSERHFVQAIVRGAYPAATIEHASPGGPRDMVVGDFELTRGNYLPIRTLFDEEPLASVIAILAHSPVDTRLQMLVRPRTSRWQVGAYSTAQRLRDGRDRGLWPAMTVRPEPRTFQFERERAKAIESKAAGLGFDCVLRVIASSSSGPEGAALIRAVAGSLLPFSAANAFALRGIRARQQRALYPERFPLRAHALLTAKELAALWHVPDADLIEELRAAKSPVPAGAERGERVIGVGATGVRVGISVPDSRSHLHVLGSTGTGKTTLLLNLAAQDIAAGRGVAVLDPKGDLVRSLLERIPKGRVSDVVLISPDESSTSVGMNPLELSPGDDRDLVAENTLTIFKRIYERYWGPRTDDVLKAALLTLLRRERATLAEIPLLLSDAEFRRRTLLSLDDPLGLEPFWRWFESISEGQRTEATGPVLNKLRDFLLRPRLRRLLCQAESTVDMRALVDRGQILLADLSVGRWGGSTAALIGSFLVARIWQAVLARSAVAEERRPDFFLYLDEFQHFLGIAGPSADALAEARSLRLSLVIANQHLGQLTRELREAVSSNARSRVVFQCGQDDAAYLARELSPIDETTLMSLERYQAAARLVVDGAVSRPFTFRTLRPGAPRGRSAAEEVRAASAMRFARPVAEIDTELRADLPSRGTAESARASWRPKPKPPMGDGAVRADLAPVLRSRKTDRPGSRADRRDGAVNTPTGESMPK
ncbi:MAG: type IV secretion system DNA-binding domain-containing protein [Chloroflexota bacterium]|nr:type IV secretion system DNA-binding domain-containing protein [Chloroflexota bacterium]